MVVRGLQVALESLDLDRGGGDIAGPGRDHLDADNEFPASFQIQGVGVDVRLGEPVRAVADIVGQIHRKLDQGIAVLVLKRHPRIRIGQAAPTLSGGEAQRVKLARELSKRSTGQTIFVLDEPSVGLHAADVHKLIEVLRRLVEGGNTVVIIEHNLDIIKGADHIVDLGPEGGERGGRIVAKGTPEEVAKVAKSYTGQALIPMLKKKSKKKASANKKKVAVKATA